MVNCTATTFGTLRNCHSVTLPFQPLPKLELRYSISEKLEPTNWPGPLVKSSFSSTYLG